MNPRCQLLTPILRQITFVAATKKLSDGNPLNAAVWGWPRCGVERSNIIADPSALYEHCLRLSDAGLTFSPIERRESSVADRWARSQKCWTKSNSAHSFCKPSLLQNIFCGDDLLSWSGYHTIIIHDNVIHSLLCSSFIAKQVDVTWSLYLK